MGDKSSFDTWMLEFISLPALMCGEIDLPRTYRIKDGPVRQFQTNISSYGLFFVLYII